MDIPKNPQIAATLLREGQASAEDVARAVVEAWHRIDHGLSSIVGTGGVAALYRRSLHVCVRIHPPLTEALGPAQRTLDPEPLRRVLHAQGAAAAAAMGADLLHTFHELLSRMVGPSLTERLLRPVWDELLGAAPTEDPSA